MADDFFMAEFREKTSFSKLGKILQKKRGHGPTVLYLFPYYKQPRYNSAAVYYTSVHY